MDFKLIKDDLFYRRTKIISFLMEKKATKEAISKYLHLSSIKNDLEALSDYLEKINFNDCYENKHVYKKNLIERNLYSIKLIPSENDIKNTVKNIKKIEEINDINDKILKLLDLTPRTVNDLSMNIYGNTSSNSTDNIRRRLKKLSNILSSKKISIDKLQKNGYMQRYNVIVWSLK